MQIANNVAGNRGTTQLTSVPAPPGTCLSAKCPERWISDESPTPGADVAGTNLDRCYARRARCRTTWLHACPEGLRPG
jgi:hypothetical protein